jgi:hypothetical protein
MILFSFIESYIKTSTSTDWKGKLNIKEFVTVFGISIAIYILMNQINQNSEHFEFKMYNKILFVLILVDLVLTATYIFRYVINNSMDDIDNNLK